MCHLASAQIIDSNSCSCVRYLHCCAFICCDLNATGWAISQVSPKLRQVPVLHWLVSQVTHILLSPGASWLIVVRQSTLVTSCHIPRNTASCQHVHVGNKASHALVVSGIRTLVNSANFGRKMLIYCTNPRNTHTSFVDHGDFQLRIFSTFPASASIPQANMLCPRKLTSVRNNDIFFGEHSSLVCLKASIIILIFVLCSLIVLDQIIISLM